MAEFKPGDRVRHKAGGPPYMVVEKVGEMAFTDAKGVWCEWWVNGKLQQGTFSPDVLEPVPPDGGGGAPFMVKPS